MNNFLLFIILKQEHIAVFNGKKFPSSNNSNRQPIIRSCRLFPAEFVNHLLPQSLSQCPTEFGVFQKQFDLGLHQIEPPGFLIFESIDQESVHAVFNDVGLSPHVGCNHGASFQTGLDGRDAETLGVRGIDEHPRPGQQA